MSTPVTGGRRETGYYSWVCFENVQKGAWFGPVPYSEVHSYEQGFTKDPNIKSFTFFQLYDSNPTNALTCDFDNASEKSIPGTGRSVDFSYLAGESGIAGPIGVAGRSDERGKPRLLMYNKTDIALTATCSESGPSPRKSLKNKPDQAQWRLHSDTTYLVKLFKGDSDTILWKNQLNVYDSDTHWTVYEGPDGYYVKDEEPWR
jgi:hypothetical protein